MLNCFFRLFFCILLLSSPLFAAHFENLIDVTIKAEDASFSLKMKSLKFNGEELVLEPSDLTKPRKLVQYKLPPGRYILNWSTEKVPAKWVADPVKEHERILVLENGDGLVRVNIRGDTIQMY